MNPINVQQMQKLRNLDYGVSIRHLRDETEVEYVLDSVNKIGVPEGELETGNLSGINASAVTICKITNKGGHVIATGIAACSENDQFDRGVGSSLAFKRAISALPWSREMRKTALSVT